MTLTVEAMMPLRCYRSMLSIMSCRRKPEYDAIDGSSEAIFEVLALTRANFPALLLSRRHNQMTISHALSNLQRHTDLPIAAAIEMAAMAN